MDPVGITTATSSLVFQIVKTGKALVDIYGKYHDAQRCIFMMQTECTVLAAALSRVEIVFCARTGSTIPEYPASLIQALDLSLVGCTLTLSILTKEIDNLTKGTSGEDMAVNKTKQARYVWNEASMNELLQQLRGQSSALAFLLEALNASSIGRILTILESGKPTFQKVEEDSASIRAANPGERYAESIRDLPLPEDADDDSRSIHTLITRDTSHASTRALAGWRRSLLVEPTTSQDSRPGQASYRAEAEFIKSLDDLRGRMKAPALSVGILSAEGSSVYVRGIRKHDCPIPVTQVDRFRISSMAFILIPTLLAFLVEQKLLRWSTTIVEALPEVAESIHADCHNTTLEMLCAQVSGITNVSVTGGGRYVSISGTEGRKAVVMTALAEAPEFLPGTRVHHTVTNLLILAFIMEKRTSTSIEDLLKAKLFDPLEMYHTGFYGDGDASIASQEQPTQPWGHKVSTKTNLIIPVDPFGRTSGWAPAIRFICNLFSSLPDLMNFLKLHLQGALGLNTSFLSASSFKKLHTPFHDTDYTAGGWFQLHDGLSRSGADLGFGRIMHIDRDKKEACILLANVRFSLANSHTEFWSLCQRRPSNLPFQNRTL